MVGSFGLIMAATMLLVMMASGEVWKKDIKVKYYSTVTLYCQENQTAQPAKQMFWITPDATLIQVSTDPADLPRYVLPSTDVSTLNITKVDDDLFGYYTCVMIDSTNTVGLARWGLNVDGADFSELEEQYRKNAVVGPSPQPLSSPLLAEHASFGISVTASGHDAALCPRLEEDSLQSESTLQYNNQAFHGVETEECVEDKQNGTQPMPSDDHEQVSEHKM